MPTSSEVVVARAAHRILESLPVGAFLDAKGAAAIFSGLEYFIPEILREMNSFWKQESLDGFLATQGRKKGRHAVELAGLCILITDQTVTPVHARMEISPTTDQITWMECRLGAPGPGAGGMMRIPYYKWRGEYVATVGNVRVIDWVYRATYGVKSCFVDWE